MQDLIDRLPEPVQRTLGQALRLRRKELKRLRSSLVTAGLDEAAADLDSELDLLLGKGEDPGLLKMFGVDDDTLERKREEEEAFDPQQRDLEDERDYRTHSLSNAKVKELVSAIAADYEPVVAVRMLNALEDGEQEREGGARANVLDTIRQARTPIVKRIPKLVEG